MKDIKRHLIQLVATAAQNANFSGFLTGSIYQGDGKRMCVPGLNCYSCPGAVGSCPIGSLQAVIGGRGRNFSYYVFGIILLFGVLFGRLICGFLCPFGFIQDLIHKVPAPRLTVPEKADKAMRWLKYLVLAAVIILPAVLTNNYGIGAPYFCKFLCPAGTLEGGIPLILTNESIRDALGWLFSWKMLILAAIVMLSVFIYRPFCKYLCPLGAFYGILNRFSLYTMQVDLQTCTHCGKCEQSCEMGVRVTENINSAECIRCGKCASDCPVHAIHGGIILTNAGTRYIHKKNM